MNLEITGKLVEKYDTQVVSERFKKREFVLQMDDEINGNVYTNYAKMQLVQAKCDIIDRFNVGDNLKVSFNVKGTRYEKEGRVSYFSNLDAWRVEMAGQEQQQGAGYGNNNNNNNYGNNNSNYNNGGNQQQPAGNVASFTGNSHGYNPAPETADDLPF